MYAEADLSATKIRGNIARLLGAFGFSADVLAGYLCEDGDACEDGV